MRKVVGFMISFIIISLDILNPRTIFLEFKTQDFNNLRVEYSEFSDSTNSSTQSEKRDQATGNVIKSRGPRSVGSLHPSPIPSSPPAPSAPSPPPSLVALVALDIIAALFALHALAALFIASQN